MRFCFIFYWVSPVLLIFESSFVVMSDVVVHFDDFCISSNFTICFIYCLYCVSLNCISLRKKISYKTFLWYLLVIFSQWLYLIVVIFTSNLNCKFVILRLYMYLLCILNNLKLGVFFDDFFLSYDCRLCSSGKKTLSHCLYLFIF